MAVYTKRYGPEVPTSFLKFENPNGVMQVSATASVVVCLTAFHTMRLSPGKICIFISDIYFCAGVLRSHDNALPWKHPKDVCLVRDWFCCEEKRKIFVDQRFGDEDNFLSLHVSIDTKKITKLD